MALSKNGFRVGRAGASDLQDFREQIHEAQEKERRRVATEKYLAEERDLLEAMYEKHGEKFLNWYYSPDVPDGGPASGRLKLIRAWDAQQSPSLLDAMLAPAVGRIDGEKENRVTWTGKEPPVTVAVWNDDDPDRVELKPKPVPQQNGTG